MLPLEARSKTSQAGDSRSDALPERLCPLELNVEKLSSVEKLIKSKFTSPPRCHHSISTRGEDIHVSVTGIIRLLFTLCYAMCLNF